MERSVYGRSTLGTAENTEFGRGGMSEELGQGAVARTPICVLA